MSPTGNQLCGTPNKKKIKMFTVRSTTLDKCENYVALQQ